MGGWEKGGLVEDAVAVPVPVIGRGDSTGNVDVESNGKAGGLGTCGGEAESREKERGSGFLGQMKSRREEDRDFSPGDVARGAEEANGSGGASLSEILCVRYT